MAVIIDIDAVEHGAPEVLFFGAGQVEIKLLPARGKDLEQVAGVRGWGAGGGLFLTLFYGVLIAMMMLAAFLYLPVTQLLAAGSPINVGTIDDVIRKAQSMGGEN